MASKPAPKKPTQDEYIKMITGPRVDVYVGPAKKHYCLPKLLLCHYSDYFHRCFNGNFIESKTQKLILPEDNVEDFSILLEYMLHGSVPPPLEVKEKGQQAVKPCMAFLEYVDKYNLSGIGDIIYEPLKTAVSSRFSSTKSPLKIEADDIEPVFRVCPAASRLRLLIVQAALSTYGLKEGLLRFQKQQLDDVPRFASMVLREMTKRLGSTKWTDSLTGRTRKG